MFDSVFHQMEFSSFIYLAIIWFYKTLKSINLLFLKIPKSSTRIFFIILFVLFFCFFDFPCFCLFVCFVFRFSIKKKRFFFKNQLLIRITFRAILHVPERSGSWKMMCPPINLVLNKYCIFTTCNNLAIPWLKQGLFEQIVL